MERYATDAPPSHNYPGNGSTVNRDVLPIAAEMVVMEQAILALEKTQHELFERLANGGVLEMNIFMDGKKHPAKSDGYASATDGPPVVKSPMAGRIRAWNERIESMRAEVNTVLRSLEL